MKTAKPTTPKPKKLSFNAALKQVCDEHARTLHKRMLQAWRDVGRSQNAGQNKRGDWLSAACACVASAIAKARKARSKSGLKWIEHNKADISEARANQWFGDDSELITGGPALWTDCISSLFYDELESIREDVLDLLEPSLPAPKTKEPERPILFVDTTTGDQTWRVRVLSALDAVCTHFFG